jgi:hypothetical protein
MALTTHEKIRKFANFQSQFVRQAFRVNPDGAATTFYVDSDDNVKFVPEFGTGTTVAGISDVQVWLGLSGIQGVSQMGVSGIDIDQGSVILDTVPDSGVSLTISYSSSTVRSKDIEEVRKEAEAVINQRVALCYDVADAQAAPYLSNLATRLSAALLLIRGYGTGARDTAADGYALYEQLMGENMGAIVSGTDSETGDVGEIGLICTADFILVDEDGEIINRNDSDAIAGRTKFTSGGRVEGRLYDITEETFRKKDWQDEVDREQPGSGIIP